MKIINSKALQPVSKKLTGISKAYDSFVVDIKKNKKKRFTLLAIAVILILGSVLYANLGLIVSATVNNKPIFRLSLIKELEKQGGKQVLESLVVKNLINQEAAKKGISVSDSDIQVRIDEINENLKPQGTDLEAALAFQNQTMDEFKSELELRIILEKLMGDKIKVSEDEIKAYYDQNKTTLFKDQKYDDVKQQIEGDLSQQKMSQEYQNILQQLKDSADIKYLTNY